MPFIQPRLSSQHVQDVWKEAAGESATVGEEDIPDRDWGELPPLGKRQDLTDADIQVVRDMFNDFQEGRLPLDAEVGRFSD